MLLSRHVDVDAKCGIYGTALIAASTAGHEKVVEISLNKNATAGKPSRLSVLWLTVTKK